MYMFYTRDDQQALLSRKNVAAEIATSQAAEIATSQAVINSIQLDQIMFVQ